MATRNLEQQISDQQFMQWRNKLSQAEEEIRIVLQSVFRQFTNHCNESALSDDDDEEYEEEDFSASHFSGEQSDHSDKDFDAFKTMSHIRNLLDLVNEIIEEYQSLQI